MMILSVVLAVVFYSLVILAVGFILNPAEIIESQQGTGLVTADAMAKAFRDKGYGQGYHCRWNVWYYYIMELLPPLGGSRAMYSMARILHDSSVFCKASSEAQNSG